MPGIRRENWNGSNWIRKDKRLAIYLRDQFRCIYCNRNLANVPARDRTLDHVVPVASGGDNEPTNLVTCCTRCNERKGDKSLWEQATDPQVVTRVCEALDRPINRALAKAILDGTLDLSDVLQKVSVS